MDERRVPTGQLPSEISEISSDASPSVASSPQVTTAPAKPRNKYLDDFEEPTWYVKNISGTILAISDPSLPISIGVGEVADLLQKADA